MLRALCAWCCLLADAGLQPPRPVQSPPAVYPPDHTQAARVELTVTVDDSGAVDRAEVTQTAGGDFDRAALDAITQWLFAPATGPQGPLSARIRVPFDFTPPPPPPPPPPKPSAPEEVSVRGRMQEAQRGGSDFRIEVADLAPLVQRSASDVLQLAPGIWIGNEGGAGHADQVFLRGFNAEQGQAIEFTVNGTPINEVDNTDGHGYADTHFIIPELIKNLRVVEGPFDPHQGDFAEAGSADYQLGVVRRGLRIEGWGGSFSTMRLLGLYAPTEEREGTFAAVELEQSSGYGVNRASAHASAMAQYEGDLGARGLYRILITSYGTHYKSAGVVRLDDVQSGRVAYDGTLDPSQGGDAQRHGVAFDVESPLGQGTLKLQTFLTYRSLRILENFTGFLLDTQTQGQSLHPQRGDGLLQSYNALTLGLRGSHRWRATLFGQQHALEIGTYGRLDHTDPRIERVRFGTQIPYSVDTSLSTDVLNLAAFVDLEINPLSWLSLRGGVRQEFFAYNVLNHCATAGIYTRNQPLDQACPAYDTAGARLPQQRASATGSFTEPKVTAHVTLPAGLMLTGSWGLGAQSLGATQISQEENAPFAALQAAEGGVSFLNSWDGWQTSARAVGFWTHVNQDLIFDPQLGRLTSASGTSRRGALVALRTTQTWLDVLASFTYANAAFDDTHLQVPYVPTTITRIDAVAQHALPIDAVLLHGMLGVALNVVGERPLPFGQAAPATAELDLTAQLRWQWVSVGVRIANVTDARYPLTQFFYASDFRSRLYPTRVPSTHVTAAAPRTVLVTAAVAWEDT